MTIITTRLASAVVGATLIGSSAGAAPLIFEYPLGSCVQNCADADLADGATGAARVVMDDAGYDPNGFFGLEALVDFSISVGDFHLDRATAPFVNFGGSWAVVPGGPTVFYLQASETDVPWGKAASISGTILDAFATVSPRGWCELDAEFPETGCQVSFNGGAFVEYQAVAPIPLPPAGLLLAGGLAALAVQRLRRRSGEAA